MKRLTSNQREALEKIERVRDRFEKRFVDEQLAKHFDIPCTPSEWVSQIDLQVTYKVKRNDIEALVKKGFIERRPTDGFGPEVRSVRKNPFKYKQQVVWKTGTGNTIVTVIGFVNELRKVYIEDEFGVDCLVPVDDLKIPNAMRTSL